MNFRNNMAANATLHCLTGCAIGEIVGLMIGTALGLSNTVTIALAVGLAFLFGYTLSTLPLIKAGLGFLAALSVVFAADTLSIAVMEIVDNLVMAIIPGAMDAGLVNPIFWFGMMMALTAAFIAAFPVNRYLIDRGKGHADPISSCTARTTAGTATTTPAALTTPDRLTALVRITIALSMSTRRRPGSTMQAPRNPLQSPGTRIITAERLRTVTPRPLEHDHEHQHPRRSRGRIPARRTHRLRRRGARE